ncbi:hypothetical protein AMECASPLE_013516 [Ameca splendens]|uniref:Uncharacterized protein n=1 Tax=Ameca splendens TaxID=208324 RepID=A0ABV0Y195_9TELE
MRVLKNSRSSRFSGETNDTRDQTIRGKRRTGVGLGCRETENKGLDQAVRWSGRRKRCGFQCVPISGGSRIIQLDPQWTGSSLWFTHT